MKIRLLVALLVSLAAATAQAATLRVVVVKVTDQAAYVQALEKGKVLLKSKGSPVEVRVWKAQYAGEMAGSIAVAVEYPDLAALARYNDLMASDPELRAWLQSLDKLRTVESESIYQELKP
jgi:ABC-type sugar transport system substrate-binding protein